MSSQQALRALLQDAWQRRAALRQRTNAYRLLDADGVELPGVTIEIYGDHALLALYRAAELARAAELGQALLGLGIAGVYLKPHLGPSAPAPSSQPLCGKAAPDEIVVHEDEQRSIVSLADGLSTGLFLDQRDNRALLRAQAQGKRVANLFCYTGSFTVAAALGGALGTVSVDISKRALRRTRANLALNACPSEPHRLLAEDARRWLERAQRRGDRYDWIVLDPPSFSRSGRQSFSVERDYPALSRRALSLLAPSGKLLAVMNHRGTSLEALNAILRSAAQQAERPVTELRVLAPPEDCRDAEGGSAVKSVLVEVAP